MKKVIALSAILAMGLCSTAFAADHQEPAKKPPVEQQHNGQPPQDNKGQHHDGKSQPPRDEKGQHHDSKGQPPRDEKGQHHDGKGQPPHDNKGQQHDGKGQPPKHDGDNKLPPPNGQHN
ncbi:TPA: acid shock protein [Kluyvera cryocrescens]|nr:acid shock protein [Kluyvera cryocrescens]